MTRVLYIQHAPAIGGSVVSLRELVVDAIKKGYHCSVVCPNVTVASLYEEAGADTYVCTVAPLNHNTAYFYRFNVLDGLRMLKVLLKTLWSFIQFFAITRKARPDLVHLNSSGLILYTFYFRLLGLRTVFHVREYIVSGYFGFRKRLIRFIANTFASAIVYISEMEYDLLKTKPDKSFVIYNYVRIDAFMKLASEPLTRLKKSRFSVLTLGGLFDLKGGRQILESLTLLEKETELWVLGSNDPRTHPEEVGKIDGQKYLDELLRLLDGGNVSDKVKFMGRVKNSARYIAQCDALIFWANSPHFPRPVFEGWLLRKPVIYFNPGFSNPYITGDSVYTITENSAVSLAAAIASIAHSNVSDAERVNRSFEVAKDNFTERNFEKIHSLYQLILK